MACVSAPAAVAVVRAGAVMSSGAARAALRNRWALREQSETNLLGALLRAGVRVLIVHLDEGAEAGLRLVERCSRHWNPVRCVVVDVSAGMAREAAARAAGAAVYCSMNVEAEDLETVAEVLLSSARRRDELPGTAVVDGLGAARGERDAHGLDVRVADVARDGQLERA
jgi:hypothetical protein